MANNDKNNPGQSKTNPKAGKKKRSERELSEAIIRYPLEEGKLNDWQPSSRKYILIFPFDDSISFNKNRDEALDFIRKNSGKELKFKELGSTVFFTAHYLLSHYRRQNDSDNTRVTLNFELIDITNSERLII